jgi:hypothetical protein
MRAFFNFKASGAYNYNCASKTYGNMKFVNLFLVLSAKSRRYSAGFIRQNHLCLNRALFIVLVRMGDEYMYCVSVIKY